MTPSDRLWPVLPLSWNPTNPEVRSRSYQASSESYPSARAPLSAMALSRDLRLSSGNWSHDQWLSRGSPAKPSGGREFHTRLNRWPWRVFEIFSQTAPKGAVYRHCSLRRISLGKGCHRAGLSAVTPSGPVVRNILLVSCRQW